MDGARARSGPPCYSNRSRRSDIERRAFAGGGDFEGGVRVGKRFTEQPVEVGVGVARIVMKGHDVLRFGELREAERLRERAVAPADMPRILMRIVLAVVDEKIRFGGEPSSGRPGARQRRKRVQAE